MDQDSFTKILDLKRKINDLLEKHPEYKDFQREIESKLNNAGSQHNRLVLIQSMLIDSVKELQNKCNELNSLIDLKKPWYDFRTISLM